MKTAVLRARCSETLSREVVALAAAWGLQPSDIVRYAVEDYVAHYLGQPNPLRRTAEDPAPAIAAQILAAEIESEQAKSSRKSRKPKP